MPFFRSFDSLYVFPPRKSLDRPENISKDRCKVDDMTRRALYLTQQEAVELQSALQMVLHAESENLVLAEDKHRISTAAMHRRTIDVLTRLDARLSEEVLYEETFERVTVEKDVVKIMGGGE
jgi:hypothetical protein